MTAQSSGEPRRGLTVTEWTICAVASIGFAFDIYELLMLPLIVRPALTELLGTEVGSPEYRMWAQLLFYVPALCGGVFGLLGGYLTDRFGRRRILVWSILLYAFSALAAGFSRSPGMLLFFRCTTFIGVCVEFVAAVAWLAELFRQPRLREAVLGYTQAFSSLGGFMVTGAYFLAVRYAELLPPIFGEHTPWRYTLISGVIPALPLLVIRPFLPESPAWQERKMAGTLRRPSFAELFQGRLGFVTAITTLMFACSYGAAFGALQQVPQIVPGLPELRDATRSVQQEQVSAVQLFQEVGGLTGRLIFAWLAVRIVGRRLLLRLFQIPGLIVVPVVFLYAATYDLTLLKWGVFLVGVLTIGQFSFWGNYLPRMYPVHLRGTGESFAANVGGRMIGTSAAALTLGISGFMPAEAFPTQLAYAAAGVGFTMFAVGTIACFWLPEPEHADLPD